LNTSYRSSRVRLQKSSEWHAFVKTYGSSGMWSLFERFFLALLKPGLLFSILFMELWHVVNVAKSNFGSFLVLPFRLF
jgi:hypothetical protein